MPRLHFKSIRSDIAGMGEGSLPRKNEARFGPCYQCANALASGSGVRYSL